ncbi:hypothetical protein FNU76_02325 [Chitinimonas arctica]|uniref:Uncharacterized protein n=1 Tax=Chitinimonas arctica TaxID=2594795 RepID=A0A516SAV0_9NEIS|nr:hypothetical protein [Chitinimonas arctica]QDQ25280.1 hypothetical protein FNU76_02325 [Chitinimonas arctica]
MGRRILSSTSGNVAARSVFPWPAAIPRPAAQGDNTGASAGYLPVSWLTDGSALQVFSLPGFALLNPAGMPIWTKTLTDFPTITALVRESIYFDAVDQAIWCLSYFTGTTPATMYLNKIVLASGALTVVGSFSAQTNNAFAHNNHLLTRPVEGAGNLSLYSVSAVNGNVYRTTIHPITGAIVTGPTVVTSANGVPLNNTGNGFAYVSADESIVVLASASVQSGSTNTDPIVLPLARNGRQAAVMANQIGFPVSMASNGATSLLRHIGGGKYTVFHPAGGRRLTGGVYTRLALDSWLNQVATLAGI